MLRFVAQHDFIEHDEFQEQFVYPVEKGEVLIFLLVKALQGQLMGADSLHARACIAPRLGAWVMQGPVCLLRRCKL